MKFYKITETLATYTYDAMNYQTPLRLIKEEVINNYIRDTITNAYEFVEECELYLVSEQNLSSRHEFLITYHELDADTFDIEFLGIVHNTSLFYSNRVIDLDNRILLDLIF